MADKLAKAPKCSELEELKKKFIVKIVIISNLNIKISILYRLKRMQTKTTLDT